MNLLLTSVVDISLVIAAALVAASALRKQSAALRHWILAAAIGCALMTPALELVVPSWHLLPARSSADAVIEPGILASYTTTVISDPAAIAGRTFGAGALFAGVTPGELIVFAWLSGVAVAVAILLVGLTRLGVFARRAERVRDHVWNEIAENASRAHGLDRPILLLRSDHPTLVVTWGLFRPRVMLPDGARHWSTERLRVVLFHEAAHVKRGDWGVQMAASLLRCVYWFNPLVWMACRALRTESERACDDLVLKAGVDGEDYAGHLLAVAREAVLLRRWSPATAIAHPSTLEGRIRAMLNARLNRQPLTRAARVATAAALLIATLLLTAASLSREIAAAQGGPGSITATLYDQHCGLLPGAAISARHTSDGRTYDGVTDRTGSFTFRSLSSGVYELTMGLPGFSTARSVIDVRAGESAERHITLPLGSLEETVTVIGSGVRSSEPPAPRAQRAPRPARPTPQPRTPGPCTGSVGGSIKQPTKVVDVKPVFPASQQGPGASAVVVFSGRIGMDGTMIDLREVAAGSRPAPEFVAAALDAVRQWEFTPTLLNGSPVETNITITVRFSSR